MLSDFSDNPSVFMNEIYTRLAAIGALSNDSKNELKTAILQTLDLYITETKRAITNEYLGLDKYQKSVMAQSVSNAENLVKYVSEIE